MTRTETDLAEIVQDHLRCDRVTSDNLGDPDFLATKDIDSLGMIELVMAIEEHFGVQISDDEAEHYRPESQGQTKSLSALARLIDRKKQGRA